MKHLLLLLAPATLTAELPRLGPLPEVAPITKEEIGTAITRGVDYLIQKQNKDGSFGGSRRTKGLNIYAPVPEAHLAFRAGSSGLALAGLLDSGDQRPEVQTAIAKGEHWMLNVLPKLRHIDPTTTYNVWGHSYGLRAIADLYKHRQGDEAKRSRLKELAAKQVAMLKKVEDVNGGWGYLDFEMHTSHFSGIPTSFSTATVLLAMKEAQETMGIELPEKQVRRALDSIEKQRTPDWSFVYSFNHRYRPRYSINRPAGSLARSQVCMAAMREFGDERVTDELLKHWQHRLCLREGWLSIGRKRPVPHETHFAISGYFYYYGFYYASECLEMLPLDERQDYIPHLARHLLSKQEKDGSWWDYPLYDYHQAYGTGYTLTALSRLKNSLIKSE
ncbi:MAG: prenyltransferase/squalene oxidase repeat-containing protein [Akkermansiaceae bacterium]